MRAIALAAIGLLTCGLTALGPARAATGHDKVEYLSSEQTRKLNRPFSEAVRVGNILYLSGVIGTVPGTPQLAPGGIEAETKQALENISAVLQRNGSSMDQVIKCTVMLADMSEWARMNAVYVTFFPKHFPARSAMGVSGLALGARTEIECIATVGTAG
jgi:2-iminobutanoate/2-iminopropanoate deaminase